MGDAYIYIDEHASDATRRIYDRLGVRGLLVPIVNIIYSKHRTVSEVLSPYRGGVTTVAARHAVWSYLSNKGLSASEIGSLFERDHSTVWSGIKKHRLREPQEGVAMDPEVVLARMRKLAARIIEVQDQRQDNESANDKAKADVEVICAAESLAEDVQSLDIWLSKKGFLPTGWSR